ncbi:MAG TPA: hypothetical protein VGO69_05190 [Pyrinomonadaceae bacterium]|jgi:hypothetical protein|nr:hypothetical protein [Pyrinomonadaceae bacterium]
MKTRIFFPLFLLLYFPAQSLGQSYDLPAGAVIVETRPVQSKAHPDRALVLWMVKPEKHPRDTPDDIYTCPEETRGSYYSGPTRISLVDTKTRLAINTVKLTREYEDDEDSFDIPYKIHDGYYRVAGVPKGREGKPVIMLLRDYNGDGRAQEFALFDAVACMGLPTTLIGYSESRDRVIQYPVNIEVAEGAKRSRRTIYWPDYLFSRKPKRPGYWKYEIDYRGRAGTLDKWEIRYNRQREAFEGSVTFIPGD